LLKILNWIILVMNQAAGYKIGTRGNNLWNGTHPTNTVLDSSTKGCKLIVMGHIPQTEGLLRIQVLYSIGWVLITLIVLIKIVAVCTPTYCFSVHMNLQRSICIFNCTLNALWFLVVHKVIIMPPWRHKITGTMDGHSTHSPAPFFFQACARQNSVFSLLPYINLLFSRKLNLVMQVLPSGFPPAYKAWEKGRRAGIRRRMSE